MSEISEGIREHQAVVAGLVELLPSIEQAARKMVRCLTEGGRVLWMGNGGSAADSQHMAAELVGRFARQRRGLPSIALTTDTSILTAVSNDFGYDEVFSRQIEALCAPGDVVVAISTSGESENVLRGVARARAAGAVTIGLTGAAGGTLAESVDVALVVPSRSTPRVQEAHLLIEHLLCGVVDEAFAEGDAEG